jgi:hypothetical protein
MITEDQLEQQCLGWFRDGGCETNSGDARSYQHIQSAVTSEFDIFRTGTTRYY